MVSLAEKRLKCIKTRNHVIFYLSQTLLGFFRFWLGVICSLGQLRGFEALVMCVEEADTHSMNALEQCYPCCSRKWSQRV